jgi:hypothetical protein
VRNTIRWLQELEGPLLPGEAQTSVEPQENPAPPRVLH